MMGHNYARGLIPMKEGFNLQDLEQTATLIVWNGQRFVYQDDDFGPRRLELDRAPSAELLDRILESVGSQAKEASRVETPFERIAPRSTLWWQGSTADGLQVPVGRAGARKIQCLELGQGVAQHALVVGRTGAGKSTLLHTLITALALAYSPDELELYLVDFKKGVEFKTYAIHNLPHARVVAIESEREFGLSVLQGLNAEINRRGELFRSIGVDHISDYRTKSAKALPRILLIVDEFQEFFVEDDIIASQASQILGRLVRQGRAFGIHVLLGSQTLTGAYTPSRSTIGQMAVRIALQCDEPDSRLILAEDNPAARLLSRPGEAIYNAANGLVEGNNLFQVAWLPDEKHSAYLKGIQTMAQERKYVPPQIVFEGNAPAEVQKNRLLSDLLLLTDWSAQARNVTVWLGEPIAIKEPTSACFRRQSGNNLLIVGQNDEAAAAMVLVSLASLAVQYKPQDASFYILNFSQVDVPYAEQFGKVGDSLPHSAQVVGRRTLAEVIAKTAAEVKERLDAESSDEKGAIFLVVFGMQHARDLRQKDDFSYGTLTEERETLSPAEQFNTILREGPDVGVFTIAWCDSYTNLMRTLDRRVLREFEMRVIFQMSTEDSSNLIDSPLGNKLGPYRALYFSEEDGRLQKFRPYGLPTEEWLMQVGEQLRKRGK
jgi:energy-coupling factor transporter ATP-binding protein EcfA2